MNYSKFLNITENALNPSRIYDSKNWAMILDLKDNFNFSCPKIYLEEVNSISMFNEMLLLRKDIEFTEYSIDDEKEIESMIEEIKGFIKVLNGTWFLAKSNETYIGEIGLVPFEVNGVRFGRLQDVDIILKFRGQGLGTSLISEIVNIAKNNKLDYLCVRALEDDWKKDWYTNLGFKYIETWS